MCMDTVFAITAPAKGGITRGDVQRCPPRSTPYDAIPASPHGTEYLSFRGSSAEACKIVEKYPTDDTPKTDGKHYRRQTH